MHTQTKKLSSSSDAQRARLLGALRKHSLNTFEIREMLNIFSPAPRVHELRKSGYKIKTIPESITINGTYHPQVARYLLLSDPA